MSVADYNNTNNPIPTSCKVVILFWAPWHEASVKNGPMDTVLTALALSSSSSSSVSSSNIQFGRVHAEENMDITNKYNVSSIPTFVLLHENGIVFEKIEGCEDVSQITQAVQRLVASVTSSNGGSTVGQHQQRATTSTTGTTMSSLSTAAAAAAAADEEEKEDQLRRRLDRLIRSSDVMVFMKGTPNTPKCGFSRQVVQILQEENIPFGSFDILCDENVRQGLKKHSNWPTYPQVYVRGEFIGGLDILKEMKEEDGPLSTQWNIFSNDTSAVGGTNTTTTTNSNNQNNQNTTRTIEERCTDLINQEKIMLFMKGLPSTPRCGFSRTIVELLNELNVSYGSYDILQDEDVRQTLKVLHNWPTFPQLYVNGELIGGLDIVQELYDDGTLKDTLLA